MSVLLPVLATPCSAATLSGRDWDRLLGEARRTGLAARLSYLLEDAGVDDAPAAAAEALAASRIHAAYIHQLARRDLAGLEDLPAAIGAPVILLKGIAYIAAGLPMARGRLLNDIDILVPKAALPACEAFLRARGWCFDEELTAYDESYYRNWAHELPPMRHPEARFELDVHHATVQPTGRLFFDPAPLFERARPLPDSPFHILEPVDQFLHAVSHLLISDVPRGGLRDLDDLHRLYFFHEAAEHEFPARVAQRAATLGLGRQLAYALAGMRQLLGGVKPLAERGGGKPETVMTTLLEWHLEPDLHRTRRRWLAEQLLLARSHYLRMRLPLLLRHLARKTLRST